jgi:hypothetical protein
MYFICLTVIFLEGCVKKWKYLACCKLLVSLDIFQNTANFMNFKCDFLL